MVKLSTGALQASLLVISWGYCRRLFEVQIRQSGGKNPKSVCHTPREKAALGETGAGDTEDTNSCLANLSPSI